jgi:uncharacterized caspase-like protein
VLIIALVTHGVAILARGQDTSPRFTTPIDIPRYALVVAAENYAHFSHVPNAQNDAIQMEKALTAVGFNVRFLPDPTDKDIYSFANELAARGGTEVQPVIYVVYFAGHGFQNSAFNYIVPVNADPTDLLDTSVPVTSLLNKLVTHTAGIAIFLFDSCRTGVTAESHKEPTVSPTGEVGFAPIPERSGAILGLAAEFGKPARSAAVGGDSDSPYAMGLMQYIPLKALSLHEVFEQVRLFVRGRTHSGQTPYEVNGANVAFFQLSPTAGQLADDERLWQEVLATNRVDCVKRYIENRPGGRYVQAAVDWLAARQSQSVEGESPCPDDPLFGR